MKLFGITECPVFFILTNTAVNRKKIVKSEDRLLKMV